ncbi:MAG: hypothetical protein ACLQBB_03785 [Solirubrobacteraceae bacterium]
MPRQNPSRVIYGVIVIGALMAAESDLHESYLDTLASAVIAATVYWLAHGYSVVLGDRLSTGGRLTAGGLLEAMAEERALLRGAAIPIIGLAIAGLAGASEETGVTVALWCAVVTLALFELLAGVQSGASRSELALETSVGLAMGGGILAMKVILH